MWRLAQAGYWPTVAGLGAKSQFKTIENLAIPAVDIVELVDQHLIRSLYIRYPVVR